MAKMCQKKTFALSVVLQIQIRFCRNIKIWVSGYQMSKTGFSALKNAPFFDRKTF